MSANNEENNKDQRQISAKRQKIVDDALVELRKAQKKINPKFLKKIREMVKNSPALIEKLGLKKSEIPQDENKHSQQEILSSSLNSAQPKVIQKQDKKDFEKIDQAKNMDVVSKLLEMNPDKKEMIKKLLSKEN